MGKTEVVKQRKTITKPVVQTIFNPNPVETDDIKPTPDKNIPPDVPHNTTEEKERKESSDSNRVSTLIHMTSHEDYLTPKDKIEENEYIEVRDSVDKEKYEVYYSEMRQSIQSEKSETYDEDNDAETASVTSLDMYSSQAASIFFGGMEPASPRNKKFLKNYEDNGSRSSQTSA